MEDRKITLSNLKHFYSRLFRVFATKDELNNRKSIIAYRSTIKDTEKQLDKEFLNTTVKVGDSVIDKEGRFFEVTEVYDSFFKVISSPISIKGYKGNSLYLLDFEVAVPVGLKEGQKVLIEVDKRLFQGDVETIKKDDFVIDKTGTFYKIQIIEGEVVRLYGPQYTIKCSEGKRGTPGKRGRSFYVSDKDLYINTDVPFSDIENSYDINEGDLVLDAKGDVFSVVEVNQEYKKVTLSSKLIINLRGPIGNNGKSFYELFKDSREELPTDLIDYIVRKIPEPKVQTPNPKDIEDLANEIHG